MNKENTLDKLRSLQMKIIRWTRRKCSSHEQRLRIKTQGLFNIKWAWSVSRGELRWTLPLLVVFHNLQQCECNIFHVFVMSFISFVTFIFLFNSYSVLLPYSDSVYFCFRYFYLFFMHFLWHFYRKQILKIKITFLKVLSIK